MTNKVIDLKRPLVTSSAEDQDFEGLCGQSAKVIKIQPEIQAEIRSTLRSVYQSLLNEAVPDRFVQIIERLEDRKENLETGHTKKFAE